MATTRRLTTMADVRAANRDAGFYFFDRGSMQSFDSTVGRTLYGGRYFITSDQFHGGGIRGPRLYTVREVRPDGSIETVGELQQFETNASAVAEIKRLLEHGTED